MTSFIFFAKPDPPTHPTFVRAILPRSPVRCILYCPCLQSFKFTLLVHGGKDFSTNRQNFMVFLEVAICFFQITCLVKNSPELAIFSGLIYLKIAGASSALHLNSTRGLAALYRPQLCAILWKRHLPNISG